MGRIQEIACEARIKCTVLDLSKNQCRVGIIPIRFWLIAFRFSSIAPGGCFIGHDKDSHWMFEHRTIDFFCRPYIVYSVFIVFNFLWSWTKLQVQAHFDNFRQILLVESAVYTILFITQIRKYCHITITIDRLIASFVRAQNYLIFAVFELWY